MKHLLAWGVFLALTAFARAERPPTKSIPVTDNYHGVHVTEHYRWLEDWNNPAVRKWSADQNTYARSLLDKLPQVDAIRARLTEIMSAKTVSFSSLAHRGGQLFAIKRQPPRQQPFLVVMGLADDPNSARVLVDPGTIDSKGTTAIDWYVPSHGGKLVAVSLSRGGTESGDVHVYEAATGRRVFEVIPRVNGGTAGGDLAWLPDDTGFFYTRYPRGKERPPVDLEFYQQVYFHKLGTPTEGDRYEFGKGFPRIAEIQLEMEPISGRLMVTVQNGSSATLSQIQAQVFTPICSACHSGIGGVLPGVMNLTAGNSFTSLVNVMSIEVPSLDRIEPGDPDNSYMIQKLMGTAGVGSRMPQGGPFLDQATMDMIREWITDGAADN